MKSLAPKSNPNPRLGTVKDKKVLPEPLPTDHPSPLRKPEYVPEGFCDHCYVPLPDDPDPETLFIYLHALRYTTETLGSWETPLPRWAGTGWEGDWRGWSDDATPAPFDNVEPDSTFSFTPRKRCNDFSEHSMPRQRIDLLPPGLDFPPVDQA